MGISDEKKREYTKRLLLSRFRLLNTNGFYGLLLMHVKFGLDENCSTAYTDGHGIYFSPKFLGKLTDSELDFVMMHEVMHIALQHCFRGQNCNDDKFHVACDTVVNSNILHSNNDNLKSITIDGRPCMHLTPNGDEGYLFTAEEVYAMLNVKNKHKNALKGNDNNDKKISKADDSFDDHSHWGAADDQTKDDWSVILISTCKVIKERIKNISKAAGDIPMLAERMLEELTQSQIDWRTILNEFVQEEVADYSFAPPDRRYDGDFFLPDFSDTVATAKDILFMIDSSGSMSDKAVSAAFSEVKGAIEQFDGKLKGWLGYFDAKVAEPVPFESVDDLKKPVGGGGTSFNVIFNYVKTKMADHLPASIIILTDGYASFPDVSQTMGIPVLWLLNNNDVKPPWGKVARIDIYKK